MSRGLDAGFLGGALLLLGGGAPPATPPTLASGTTLAAMQAGSLRARYTVAIEGYRYILTDGDVQQAIDAWYSRTSTSHYTEALTGLFVELENAGEISPWNPLHGGGRCTLHVIRDDADTFAIDTHRREAGAETELRATLDRDDTTATVASTSNFDASGEFHCGTECVGYTGKSTTTFTGLTRGKYAPFPCDPAGPSAGVGFSQTHRVGLGKFDVGINPEVSAQPRKWVGKWVGVWLHKYDPSIPALNSVDDALLVYAGKIESIADDENTGATVIELKHVLDVIAESQVGALDPFEAIIPNKIRLDAGMAFSMWDRRLTNTGAGTSRTANVLEVVASVASGVNEINAGYYTHSEIFEALNAWWSAERFALRLSGHYSIGFFTPPGGEINSYIWWGHVGAASDTFVEFKFGMPNAVMTAFGFSLDTTTKEPNTTNFLYPFYVTHADSGGFNGGAFRAHVSPNELYRSVITYGGPTTGSTLLEEITGTFRDQYAFLPSAFKPITSTPNGLVNDGWGIFLVDGRFLIFAAKVGDTLHEIDYVPTWFGFEGALGNTWYRLPWRQDSPDYTSIRQVFVFEMTEGYALKAFLKSTGNAGYNDVDFDTLAHGVGLAIPHGLAGDAFLDSIDDLPHADKPIAIVIDKPTRFAELFAGDLILRSAFLRWNQGSLEFGQWRSPTASNSVATLSESNKAAPVGTTDHQRSPSVENGTLAQPCVKILFNRVPGKNDDDYRDSITVIDKGALDEAGGNKPPLTLKARNTYGELVATGAGIEAIAPGFVALHSMFSRPVRIISRPISLPLFETIAPGAPVLVADNFARDPATGARGVSARYGIVLRKYYTPGGWTPGELVHANPMGGTVDIMLRDVNRVGAYVPAAMVDHTQTNGGHDAAAFALAVFDHKFSETTDALDITRFAIGDKVRIIERDPSDPASPLLWDRTIADNDGTRLELNSALSSPAWDATKKYNIIFDDYADAVTAQRLHAYQADDADAMIADMRAPMVYGIGVVQGGTPWAAADPVELPPNATYGDGVGRDVATDVALMRLINNIINYKSQVSSPHLLSSVANVSGSIAFGTATWLTVQAIPLYLTEETPLATIARYVNVAPHYRSGNGSSARCRISIIRTRPTGSSYFDVDRGIVYSEATFTTSSTTWSTPTAQQLDARVKNAFGLVWVLVEVDANCECWGLPYLQESERSY